MGIKKKIQIETFEWKEVEKAKLISVCTEIVANGLIKIQIKWET